MSLSNRSVCIAFIITLVLSLNAFAQAGRGARQSSGDKKAGTRTETTTQTAPQPKTEPTPPAEAQETQETEVVKVNTNLVTVPVVASDRSGLYVPDMRQEEFELAEDGVKQAVIFFATTKEPFHVILMLDTSASTQEKLGQIQQAAIAFVQQLQPADRVKIISFDDQIHDYGDFTSDRALLQSEIRRTQPGKGTKLYDAMTRALNLMRPVQGRKAIVLFTDGVDSYSDRATYNDTLRGLDEAGIIVYPIRFDTRAETERLLREQARNGQQIDLGVILGGNPPGTTPTTLPGGTIPTSGNPQPSSRRSPNPSTFPNGIPGTNGQTGGIPSVVLNRRTSDPRDTRDPNSRDNRYPDPNSRDDRFPDASNRYPVPTGPTTSDDRTYESIHTMLDMMYGTADAYLGELAQKSGGKLERADTLSSLPDAFARIADELRTQYSLGYYPTNTAHDGTYRQIQVRSTRKNVAVRARPGYRAPGS